MGEDLSPPVASVVVPPPANCLQQRSSGDLGGKTRFITCESRECQGTRGPPRKVPGGGKGGQGPEVLLLSGCEMRALGFHGLAIRW